MLKLYKFPRREHTFGTLRALLRLTMCADFRDAVFEEVEDAAFWHQIINDVKKNPDGNMFLKSRFDLMASVRIIKRHVQVQIRPELKTTAAVVAAWHRRRFEPAAFTIDQEQNQ